MSQITKAFNAYVASALTDGKVAQGVESILGRELNNDELVEVLTLAYGPFKKAYEDSK